MTIKDVAAACGCAVSTVSNALADKSLVTPETKALVVRTAERLGYRPSNIAQAMRTSRTSSVGFVVADISHPFTAEVARGVEDALSEDAYNLTICNTDYRAEQQRRQLNELISRNVDGILMLLDHPDSPDVAWLKKARIPFILLSRGHRTEKTTLVGFDNRRAMDQILEHLWELGHRHIAFMVSGHDSTIRQERLDAYEAFLKRRKVFDRRFMVTCSRSVEGGRKAAASLLGLPLVPTAIIAWSDLEALGAMGEIEDRGLRVPADVSVVGGGDTFLAELPQIRLTAIAQPRRELGRFGAKLLIDILRGEKAPSKPVLLDASLVARHTTEAVTRVKLTPPRPATNTRTEKVRRA